MLKLKTAIHYPRLYKRTYLLLTLIERIQCFFTGHDWHLYRGGGKRCKNCDKQAN